MLLIELTVPAEENFKSSRDYKLNRYKDLVNDLHGTLTGWAIELACIEVGARGLHQDTLSTALGASAHFGLTIKPPKRELHDVSFKTSLIALKCSLLIWQTRKTTDWPNDVPFFPF